MFERTFFMILPNDQDKEIIDKNLDRKAMHVNFFEKNSPYPLANRF